MKSYASKATLDFNVPEGISPRGDSRSLTLRDEEGETSSPMIEVAQGPLEPATALPCYTTDDPSFKGMVDRPLQSVCGHSHFYMPAFAQYNVSSLVGALQTAVKPHNMVRLVKDAFQYLDSFNWDL